MKTHLSNLTAHNLKNDILGQTIFQNHQYALHSGNVKPIVVTKRKEQVKITKNKKVELNSNPNQHVNHLFSSLHNSSKNKIKSTLDNKMPDSYKLSQTVLKDKIKKNKLEKHINHEHQREWKALQNRIQNCKSLNQRKKDNTDPIVNPVYFIKDGSKAGDLTIQPYCKKVLQKNRPKSAVVVDGRATKMSQTTGKFSSKQVQQPNQVYYGASVPDYSKTGKNVGKIRPQSANQGKQMKNKISQDLPQPSYKGILSYLLNNKIYKDSQIKVLYVRLCYAYGEDHIDEVWQRVMDHLES